ncbi:PEP-CTERM sorting domain-containing protein [Desulfopila sp. IMCC35008]|uniref:PEP-CTERM sorting domain-containing protein n=1 Tax=Desulfopila sp. IMCC35008 TaxID=2653858 RepID=UPI001F0F07B4|nr:PEP-CTERM sorting domain-containing protein [Desulfopila sp. IMCC35008]
MKKSFLKTLALAIVGSLCVVGAANALPMLEGGLSMTGLYTPVNAGGSEVSIELATGIDFGAWLNNADNTFVVSGANGSFTSLIGTIGNITDFQFVGYTYVEDVSLWSAGNLSFEMSSLTWDKGSDGDSNDIHVYGLGVMNRVGYDDTPGVWNFTGQGADEANFSWSASVAASPVPEPATMLLFGTGLAGLAGLARRKKN